MALQSEHHRDRWRGRACLLALFVLASGCKDEPDGRSDILSLFFPPSRPAPSELLQTVEEIYGMEIRLNEEGYGAIQVYLYEDGTPEALGEAADGTWCSHSLWSIPDPFVLAHQIGHASGLEHVDSPEDNLMFVDGERELFDLDAFAVDPNRAALEDWQIDVVRHENWRNRECWKIYEP